MELFGVSSNKVIEGLSDLTKGAGKGVGNIVRWMGHHVKDVPVLNRVTDAAKAGWGLVKPWLESHPKLTTLSFSVSALYAAYKADDSDSTFKRIGYIALCIITGGTALLVATDPTALGMRASTALL